MSDRNKYLKSLESRVNNIDLLSDKMKNFKHGIIDNQPIDIRTQRERGADKNYIYQVLRTKVFDLFNNDPEMSEEFMELVSNSEVTPGQFSIALPQLKINFKGSINDPMDVMTNLRQLIQNFEDGGTVSGSVMGSVRGDESIADNTIASAIDAVQSAIQDAFAQYYMPKDVADELTDVVNVLKEELPENENLKPEEQDSITDSLEKLRMLLDSSSGGSTLKKVTQRAQEDFQNLINLLAQNKETSVDVVLEQFVNIVESISVKSKDIQDEKDLKDASKITIETLKKLLKEYGIKPGKANREELKALVWNHEVEKEINDGMFIDFDIFPDDV